MVHVVSCHHFVSQDVFLSKQEPVAFCCAEEKLFVATNQPSINVHDLDSRGNILHTFPTVDQVTQVVFCEKGNYVATLEKKILKQGSVQTFVRIYFKWWMDFTGQSPKSRIPRSSNAHLKNQPEMLELPLKSSSVLAIACCRKTAVLGISLGHKISVFCQSWKVDDIPKLNQRFFHHVMDMDLNFIVKELCIYERYFACRSEYQVRVFKVTTESDNNQVPVDNNSFTDLKNGNFAENFIEWRFESCLENGSSDNEWENHLRKHLHPNSFPITITFPTIEKANQNCDVFENCEIFGPILTVKGYKIKINLDAKAFEVWSGLSAANITTVTLFYREFEIQDHNKLLQLKLLSFGKSDGSSLVSLDPLHAAAIESEKASSALGLPFQHNDECQNEAIGCFISTSQVGFMYDILHGVKMVGSYQYTANLKTAVLEPTFLHALTDAGLETYSLHLSHRTIQHLENVDNVKNACPDFNSPICLLGLRPFLGAHNLSISENHLVLISSSDELDVNIETPDSGGCTIYALRKPIPQQIFTDLLEVGHVCKTSSPATYQLILSEGHMILRTHLFLGKHSQNELRKLYKKSCILLADHYACNSNDESVLAAPYYHMSQLPVEEVVQRFFSFRNKLKHNVLKPLIHYLNPVLVESKSPILVSVSKSIAENILDAYMDEAPEHLWKVILCSGLTGYRIEKAMLMLKRRITSKRHLLGSHAIAADTVAIVSLLLKKNNAEAAQNMMQSLLKSDLAAILTDIHFAILSKEGISSLGKFVMQVRPESFIHMLIYLVEKDQIKIKDVIQMLQDESSDKQAYQILLLKDFLEILVYDKKDLLEKNPDCIMLLVKIYLKSLIEKQPLKENSSNSKVSNPVIFGPRPPWLKELPPFNGKSISRACSLSDSKTEGCEEEECLCRACQEDLLRLQALLYQNRSMIEIREQVLEFLSSGERQISGHESLEVLCLDEERAIKKLLDVAPSAILQFSLDIFGGEEQKWCILFSTLQKIIYDIPEDDNKYEVYSKTFDGVLQHLAETMTILNFVSILPKGETFYEPYVKLCVKKHRAKQLKNKIIALGNEIKALM